MLSKCQQWQQGPFPKECLQPPFFQRLSSVPSRSKLPSTHKSYSSASAGMHAARRMCCSFGNTCHGRKTSLTAKACCMCVRAFSQAAHRVHDKMSLIYGQKYRTCASRRELLIEWFITRGPDATFHAAPTNEGWCSAVPLDIAATGQTAST